MNLSPSNVKGYNPELFFFILDIYLDFKIWF